MKNDEKAMNIIEEMLVSAYRTRNNLSVSKEWQKGVMEHVCQLSSEEKSRANDRRVFGKIIWRFAMASSLSAVALLLYAIRIDVLYEDLIADLFTTNPLNFIAG